MAALSLENLAENLLTTPEINLMKMLSRFGSALEKTLDARKPSLLTTYLIDLTKDFGLFYRECKVMDPAHPERSQARLALVLATKLTLARGMELLGIPKPEKM
jgi:arginyl-tRNA synthetase